MPTKRKVAKVKPRYLTVNQRNLFKLPKKSGSKSRPLVLRAYKFVAKYYRSPTYGYVYYYVGTEVKLPRKYCDKRKRQDCGAGLNVATKSWCKDNMGRDFGDRMLLVHIRPEDVVCVPTNSDGKFRVCRLKVVKEIT